MIANLPFAILGNAEEWDVEVTARGGGIAGQMGAVRLGISRALVANDAEVKPALKKEGLMTRDSRAVSLFKVLNCENFHFLDKIKYDKFDDFVVDYDKDEEDKEYWKKYKCDICSIILKNITPGGPYNGELFLCKCGAYVCNECYEYHEISDSVRRTKKR